MAYCRKYLTSKGETRYRAEIRVRGAKPISKSFNRLTDAKVWAREEEARLQRYGAGIGDNKSYLVSDAIERYLEEHLPTLRRSGLKLAMNWWKQELGHMYLRAVGPSEIIAARNKLAKEPKVGRVPGKDKWGPLYNHDGTPKLRSPKTIQDYVNYLGALFNKAMLEWGWAERNPVKGIKKLKIENERNRFLSDHYHLWPGDPEPRRWEDLSDEEKADAKRKFPRAYELPRLFEALKAHVDVPVICRNKPLWTFYLCIIQLELGLRLAEAANMVWEENDLIKHPIVVVDLTRKVLYLKRTKQDCSPRLKPISNGALNILLRLYEDRRFDSPLVFPREDGQGPFKFRERIVRAIRVAGLQDFRWHDLRHTTASYLSMMGAGQREIMEALHHKTMISSQRYQHLSNNHMRGLLNNLSDVVGDQKRSSSRFD